MTKLTVGKITPILEVFTYMDYRLNHLQLAIDIIAEEYIRELLYPDKSFLDDMDPKGLYQLNVYLIDKERGRWDQVRLRQDNVHCAREVLYGN